MSEPTGDQPAYADRMFPAPVDLGIAESDRAVSSVRFGTESFLAGGGGEGSAGYEGGGRAGRGRPLSPPPRGCEPQGGPFEPVKIGVLIDMDLGQLLADWIDPTMLAIEDALNEGVWGGSPARVATAE